ncbi:MAG: YggS family pyridoxal phosphate-dependent enzyme [Bacteroidales bacterium]|jgi:pyridoxal phosphate enzyme (YggS family)|nr:YggS family pyridoxal phosphate-dependent enzyme [Bacteroidales bacterium]
MNIPAYKKIKRSLPKSVRLIAVSKTKPVSDIAILYQEGQRIFGENKAIELRDKADLLPKDIQWHFIGHLQTNKIKYIAPFVALIHSIDSFELLQEVNKYGIKNNRVIPCLLQFYIANEESKFGFTLAQCEEMLQQPLFHELKNIEIVGVMGMATFTDDRELIASEFQSLTNIFNYLKKHYFKEDPSFKELSMGMSDDYPIAIAHGSTMVRIGSAIFGERG